MLNGVTPLVWGDGTQKRDFIYVTDCADLMIEAMKWNINKQKQGTMEIFNVGTGIGTSFNEVIAIINQQLSTNYTPRYVSVPVKIYSLSILADMTKVQNVLGWKPKVTVEQGIKKIIENTRKLPPRFGVGYQNKYTLDRSYVHTKMRGMVE